MPNQFEMELSALANSYFQAKKASASKYKVGFELVDFDEKKSKGIGYFILNVNGRYLYALVFFINGAMKDFVLLYDKKLNQFYPFTDEWLRFFSSVKSEPLGNKIDQIPSKRTLDFKTLADPFLFKSAQASDLMVFLKEASLSVQGTFLELVKRDRNLLDHCLSKYGNRFRETIGSFAQKTMNKSASKSSSFEPFDVITSFEKAAQLDAFDKVDFMRTGYVVKDKRDQKILYKKFNGNIKSAFCNVTEPGVYQINTQSGIKDMVVSPHPFYLNVPINAKRPMAIEMSTGTLTTVGSSDEMVVLKNRIKTKSIDVYMDELDPKKIENMESNKKYALFSPEQMNFSVPFEVTNKTSSKGKTFFSAHNVYSVDHSYTGSAPMAFDNNKDELINKEFFIVLTDRQGKISKGKTTIFVPKETYVVEIKDIKSSDYIISDEIMSSRIHDFMNEYEIKSGSIRKNGRIIYSAKNDLDGILFLAKEANLSIQDAKDSYMFNDKFCVQFPEESQVELSKKAQMPMPNNWDFTPNYRVEHKNIERKMSPNLPNSQYERTKNDVDNLIQLSKLEDLKIFDDGMIGILQSLQSPESVLQREIPSLVQAMNRLGRILFIIWYHAYLVKESFEIDEYGEFEERVQDTFDSLGKIILKLQKKDLQLMNG